MALTKVTGAGLGLITGDIATSTAGINNFKAGASAGLGIVSGGNYNVAVGDGAGRFLTTGDKSTFVGFDAGKGITGTPITGSDNTAVGTNAGLLLQGVAAQNTLIGSNAGDAITTGADNTAVGFQALTQTNTGHSNVAMGTNACNGNSTGLRNTGIGFQALANGLTANDNTGLGYNAGVNLNTGAENVAVGSKALQAANTGANNVAIGFEALIADTKGFSGVAVGAFALLSQNFTSNTDSHNVAVGINAGKFATTATDSTFIGANAGKGITGAKLTGNVNTAVGSSAGLRLQGTADENVMVGSLAGQNVTTGSGNVCIGHSAETSSATSTNQIIMGESVTGVGNNNFTFGFGSSDSNIDFGETSITAPSDQRYKEDITTATAGLSFIKDLRPVTFKWKKEKDLPTNHRAYVDGSETRTMNDYTNHGFLAQEVKTVIDAHSEIKNGFSMWKTDEQADGGRQRLGDGALMPMMVKAMQELSTALDAALARIATLEG